MTKISGTVGSVLKRKGTDVWFVATGQTVYEAIERMANKGVGALLVMETLPAALLALVGANCAAKEMLAPGLTVCGTFKPAMLKPVPVTEV